MIQNILLSWAIGTGQECRGGKRRDPQWTDVENHLKEVEPGIGSVSLDVIDGPDVAPLNLQVIAENGKFLLMLGEDDGQEYKVRTFNNSLAEPGIVVIHGDSWDSRSVFEDFAVVYQAFREFYDSGDVSHEILN